MPSKTMSVVALAAIVGAAAAASKPVDPAVEVRVGTCVGVNLRAEQ